MGISQLRPVARHLSFGLSQLHLKWTRIDFGQQVTAANSLALFEPYLHQLPVDATPHRHGIERNNRPESVEIDADVARFRRCNHDRHGA